MFPNMLCPPAKAEGWASQFCGRVPSVFRAGLHGPNPRREAAGAQHTIGTLSVNRVLAARLESGMRCEETEANSVTEHELRESSQVRGGTVC